jgi:hypothetical protein
MMMLTWVDALRHPAKSFPQPPMQQQQQEEEGAAARRPPGGPSIPGRHGRASASLPYTIHRPAHETAGTRLKDGDGVRRTRGRASVSRRGSAAVATTRAFGPVRRAGTNRSPSALRALTARRCRRNIHPISPVSTFSSTGRTYGLRLTPSATRYLASSYTDFFSFHRNI